MKVKELTFNAMFIAIMAVLALVPNLGIITIGPISITILHIPVIVAGVTFGFKTALITATTFGVSTMIVAMTRAVTPIDLLFINPIISVFPRILFGIAVGILWASFSKLPLNKNITMAITAVLSTILHAFFVLTVLYFFLGFTGDLLTQLNQYVNLLISVFVANTLVEAIAAVVFTIPLAAVLNRIK